MFKTLFATLAAALLLVTPALADSFSFNHATAAKMIEACKDEGISFPKEVADAIVKAREAGAKFATEEDLLKVPGMTPQIINQLDVVFEKGDAQFVPYGSGMKAY